MSEKVLDYHTVTKHRFEGYAPSPGFLDWDSQPNPFRHYKDAPTIELKLFKPISEAPKVSWSLDYLSYLFQFSLGISAWKVMGPERWSLRVNPSSGNLHPTEAYLITWEEADGLAPGVYHYDSYKHQLEQRCKFSKAFTNKLHDMFPTEPGAIAFSTITWREEWKYGARAYRYCQLDVGHALAAVVQSQSLMGGTLLQQPGIGDEQLSNLLGLSRADDFAEVEPEDPDLFALISLSEHRPPAYPADMMAVFDNLDGVWYGKPSRLSGERVQWPEIKGLKPYVVRPAVNVNRRAEEFGDTTSPTYSAHLIKNRRSAQRMDKKQSSLPREKWLSLLKSVTGTDPLSQSLVDSPNISLMITAHNVDGIESGFYFLSRNEEHMELLKKDSKHPFLWSPVTGLENLYYMGTHEDTRKVASQLSCYQAIAGHGAFCVSMLADFTQLEKQGPWIYRDFHIEAGLIGQALYIEAEKNDLNGTGIGCFFDDEVHNLLGLPHDGSSLQVVYHFTVGKARLDERLVSEPAYAHLPSSRKAVHP